jgi:hypothetical protein
MAAANSPIPVLLLLFDSFFFFVFCFDYWWCWNGLQVVVLIDYDGGVVIAVKGMF